MRWDVVGQVHDYMLHGSIFIQGAWSDPLDIRSMPLGGLPVWARADAANYCMESVEACQQRGRVYSVSVTDPRKNVQHLRIVNERKLEEGECEPLNEGGCERAVTVLHRLAGRNSRRTW